MNKVIWNDKKLLKSTFSFLMLEGSILGVVSIFINEIIIKYSWTVITIIFILMFVYYFGLLYHVNHLKKLSLKIKTSTFEIKSGDIFKEDVLKVISFNEYFDTQVDNRIIAENSLNGAFINNYVNDVKELDSHIANELKDIKGELNKKRKKGKIIKYHLGTIVEYNGFLLTSFTKFDDDNKANLDLKEYLLFLMNFWDNLTKVYAGRSVAITLFGSSNLTQFNDANNISDQDLIEIIIWTFKVSKIKFKYPTKITLVLTDDLLKKINLYEIKEMYDNGI